MDSYLVETEYGWLVMPNPCEDDSALDVIHEVHWLGPKIGWRVYPYVCAPARWLVVKPGEPCRS